MMSQVSVYQGIGQSSGGGVQPVDVVGVGQNSVDYVCVLPEWPATSGARSKLRVRHHAVRCGGQTATAMAACARLGLRTKYVGAVGADDNGHRVRRALAVEGVDLTDLVVLDHPTGWAVILVDETSGERIVLWDRDDRLALRDADLRPEMLAGARLVHVDDGDLAVALRVARMARDLGIPVTSDIDKVLDRTEELAGLVTYPILAEHVPVGLTGEADLERALRRLGRSLARPIVVTLGARGALALEGDRLIRQPGIAVAATDTTGAGDVFRAGFIYAVLRGSGLEETLRFATAAAAASCRRPGAIDGAPGLEEVERLLR